MNLGTISSEHLNKELAYLLGVYLTDGSIVSRTKPTTGCTFQLQVIDKEFAEYTLECLKKILPNCKGNVNRNVQSGSGFNKKKTIVKYCVGVGFTEWRDFFEQQTGKKHHIPLSVWNASLDLKKWFIAGIMDGDGYISYVEKNRTNPRITIGIGKSSDGWIWEFKQFLEKMGIRINKPEVVIEKNGNGIIPMVKFKINVRDFIGHGLFFTIIRKQKKLVLARHLLPKIQERNY